MPPLTDNWKLEAVCPCLDVDLGFPVVLSLPTMTNPPWNATINAYHQKGDLRK